MAKPPAKAKAKPARRLTKAMLSKAAPAKGKAKVKVLADGRRVSYGQAGKAKGGGPRVKPGTRKGDAFCARSAGQMRDFPKAARDPNSPLRLSRAAWKCSGKKSRRV